jgi:hypothetical protein
MIDENLMRAELGPAERAVCTARRFFMSKS